MYLGIWVCFVRHTILKHFKVVKVPTVSLFNKKSKEVSFSKIRIFLK